MKVTALLPDELIQQVKDLSEGSNITESLVIALNEWVAARKLKELNQRVRSSPLRFRGGFGATKTRQRNRKR